MDILTKSTIIKLYKRKDIQDVIIAHARDKEIGMQFGLGNFAKRPDVLNYPHDILELALRNVTSFHASEERWSNPLALSSELSKKEQNNLRIGWDLVLDIDCPDWEFSKITTHLLIKALKDNDVKDISCKFSGNKGFHIGVPFETFPKIIAGRKTKDLFPEGPKKIAQYLLDYIAKNYIKIKENKIIFGQVHSFSLEQFKLKFGEQKFLLNLCSKCKREVELKKERVNEFICPKCENKIESENEFSKCAKCNIIMEKFEKRKSLCKCGSDKYHTVFNPLSVIEVDTVLISSRHLYRMPYSLHEKSALVSLPIDPETVLYFKKEMAKPEKILVPIFNFLDRNINSESGRTLLLQALDFEVKVTEDYNNLKEKDFEEIIIESAIKEEFFPPCVNKILTGLEDGKKRAIFILMNFLGKIGWNKNEIVAYLTKWNKEKNPESLREAYIRSQLNNFKPGDKLPPNCDNEAYCKGIGVCLPDNLCQKIKNPVNYTILRWKSHLRDNEDGRKKGSKKKKEDNKEEKDNQEQTIDNKNKEKEIKKNSTKDFNQ